MYPLIYSGGVLEGESLGYLLRRIYEVAEEHGIVVVVYVNEAYTSSKCPIHKKKCGKKVKRGLFKCTRLNKVFNADLVGAYNILITPSPERDRGNGPKTRPGTKPSGRGDVVPNLPAPSPFRAERRSAFSWLHG